MNIVTQRLSSDIVSGDAMMSEKRRDRLRIRDAMLLCLGAGAAFQLAYTFPACAFLIVVYLWCLYELTRLATARQASYIGLLAGFLTLAPQLYFFWNLFGPAAIALWFVCAFWIRMFLVLGRAAREHFGSFAAIMLIPFLWTGLEYFRSELYYLRFSWLNAGYVFAGQLDCLPMKQLGMYGFGFVLMAIISLSSLFRPKLRFLALVLIVAAVGLLSNLQPLHSPSIAEPLGNLPVAGIQMEFASELEIIANLNKLAEAHPEAQLLVLSEYTVDGPVPEKIKVWCREHGRYLVIGGKDPATNSNYYDTAFVVGPDGQTVFKQGKSVPVQFFKDGLPAKEQTLWNSPWGKIGFCICYDLSYTRVTDPLIPMGAQAIIVPTMDVEDWGRHQHELHARVAMIRAAEYGVPIFRVASSGISQCVDRNGNQTASAPMPGDAAMIAGTLDLKNTGSLPWDRVIAPAAVCATLAFTGWLAVVWFWAKLKNIPRAKTI